MFQFGPSDLPKACHYYQLSQMYGICLFLDIFNTIGDGIILILRVKYAKLCI